MSIRPPAVAGYFYPADERILASEVDQHLEAVPEELRGEPYVRAVLAPHAGYEYSGATAAIAYRQLDPETKRVVLFGPTHRVPTLGLALSGAAGHATPLGTVPEDQELAASLATLPGVQTLPAVHAEEHSLEVHLPFLQRYLRPGFTAVPVAVGDAPAETVAAAIARAWEEPDTAIIISSDLSHYLPDAVARQVDAAALEQIAAAAGTLGPLQACGAYPLSGMMEFARNRNLSAKILFACNSSDTAGDRDRVVGYAAAVWE